MADDNINILEDDELELSKESKIKTCDSCGGDLKYNPYKKKLVCIFCSREFELELKSDNVRELDLEMIDELFKDTNWGVETKVIECKNCGGKTVSSTADKTTFCAFCGSQHIVKNIESSGIKPQGLVPYSFDNREAKELMKSWVSKCWLAPNDLKKSFLTKELQTVYYPYWTFDTRAISNYYIELGTEHRDRDGEVYKVTWESRRGTYKKHYDDFLQIGVDSDLNRYMKKIKPFETTDGEVVDYEPSFLAGCQAKKYTVEPDEAWKKTRDDIYEDLRLEIKWSFNADKRRNFEQVIEYTDNSFKYIMLPVYIAAYQYNDKTYNVVINGQTKKIYGNYPKSVYKIAGIIAVVALIMFLVAYFS